MGALNGASRRALRDGEQIWSEIGLPARQQKLLAGLARAVAVVAIGFSGARNSAAGRVPLRAGALQRKAVALGGLPVEARKAGPLRGGALGGAEQAVERLKHLRVFGKSAVVVGSQLRAKQLDLVVGGLGKESLYRAAFNVWAKVGMFDHRHAGIVVVEGVERREPEELVAANASAHPDARGHFVVRWTIVLRLAVRAIAKDGDSDCRGRRGLLYPLRKWVARAPVVLPIEEEYLAVQIVRSPLRLHAHSSCAGARALGFNVAGDGAYLADGGFGNGGVSAAGPCLAHACGFWHTTGG